LFNFVRRILRPIVRAGTPKRFNSFSKILDDEKITREYSPSWVHRQVAEKTKPLFLFSNNDIEQWRIEGREKLIELLSIPNNPATLKVEELWQGTDERGSYQKVRLEGEFGSKIPVYICVPFKRRRSGESIICLQGHNSGMHNSLAVAKDSEIISTKPAKEGDFVNWCFDNGFTAVCLEQRCFGERTERHQLKRSEHPCHDAALQALLLGRTLMGERLADVELCVRYMQERDVVAGNSKIGVMGNSLGGTVAVYANAILEEIDFAIGGSCTSTLDESIGSIYHCADLYIPKLREFFEFAEILGLAAPKPLLLVQGLTDPIFPYKGLKKVKEAVDSIYRANNAASNFVVKIGSGGHRFYPELASEGIKKLLRE
jgi:dienelactone hydrolase